MTHDNRIVIYYPSIRGVPLGLPRGSPANLPGIFGDITSVAKKQGIGHSARPHSRRAEDRLQRWLEQAGSVGQIEYCEAAAEITGRQITCAEPCA